MKTAEEWMNQMSGLNNPALLTVNRMAIHEIQLDAMKEGMRRAATVVVENNQPVFDLPTRLHTRQALGQAILTAAEQLTEKDL